MASRRVDSSSAGWGVLGGSWVVISGVINRVTIVTTRISGLMTLLLTTHEPPSTGRFMNSYKGYFEVPFKGVISGVQDGV